MNLLSFTNWIKIDPSLNQNGQEIAQITDPVYRNLDYWKQRSILAEIKVENLESEVKRLKSSLLLYQDRERYWNQKYILEECKANITDQNARQ